ALVRDVTLALLVEGDACPMTNELMRQRSRHAADPEREDDVLDRRTMTRFDDALDELLLASGIDLAGHRSPEDLVRLELRIARPTGGVDERNVELVDDLAVREQERRLHPELAPAGVLRDGRLL